MPTAGLIQYCFTLFWTNVVIRRTHLVVCKSYKTLLGLVFANETKIISKTFYSRQIETCYVLTTENNFNIYFYGELKDWTIHKWISEGAPSDKLVLGTTGKALSFYLSNPNSHGVGAPVNGPTDLGGVFPKQGSLSYFEVCRWLKQGATVKWDDEQKMNYAYRSNVWVGYESPRSMKEKVKYAKGMGLGGMMFWSFDLDDFYFGNDLCSSVRFPLLKALREAATNGNYTHFTTTSTTTTTTRATTTTTLRVTKAPVTRTPIPDSVTSDSNNTGKSEQNNTGDSTPNTGEQSTMESVHTDTVTDGQTGGSNEPVIQTDKPLILPPSDDILDEGCALSTNILLIAVLSVIVAIFNTF